MVDTSAMVIYYSGGWWIKNVFMNRAHKKQTLYKTTQTQKSTIERPVFSQRVVFCWTWNFTCLKLRKVMDKTNQVCRVIAFDCYQNWRTGRVNELLSLGVEFGSLLTFEFRKIINWGSSCVLIDLGAARRFVHLWQLAIHQDHFTSGKT